MPYKDEIYFIIFVLFGIAFSLLSYNFPPPPPPQHALKIISLIEPVQVQYNVQ